MAYFKEFPIIRYPSFLTGKNSSLDYVEVANLFRRVKLREDIQKEITLFDKYEIPEGFRPDNVAEDLYGSDELDWVVIICSGITNIRHDWPMSNSDIYNYAEAKYGNDLADTRFFKTKEIKDSRGRVVLPAGKIVDETFSYTFYDSGLGTNVVKSGTAVKNGISNLAYEIDLNEKRRTIFVLKPGLLQQFLNDFRDIMVYGKSSQFIDERTIQTENLNITMP